MPWWSCALCTLEWWLVGEAGWTHGALPCGLLSNPCPSPAISLPSYPLVVDCPAGCVCLHRPGVQLDRATLWQVPQPGTSALDVQRTVHICQVCVCLLRPRWEETSGRPGCLLCWGPRGGGLKSYTGAWIYQLWLEPSHKLMLDATDRGKQNLN